MVTDCHAHLDAVSLSGFLNSLKNIKKEAREGGGPQFRVISNSTDVESSRKNIEIASSLPGLVMAFVGIHPQAVVEKGPGKVTKSNSEEAIKLVDNLVDNARGIGEIGLDSKYGLEELQLEIFKRELEIAESKPWLPISLHTRNTIEKVAEILSSYQLSNRVLLHWFAGTDSELRKIQARGYYVSFGPALIFSKRLQGLAKAATEGLILAETDSPLVFSSLMGSEPVSPFIISSVIFKLSEVRNMSYDETMFVMEENAERYIQAQNSLRVKGE